MSVPPQVAENAARRGAIRAKPICARDVQRASAYRELMFSLVRRDLLLRYK